MTLKTNHSVIGETNIVSSPWKTITMPNKVVYMMQKESSYRPISLLFGNSKIFQDGSSHIWIQAEIVEFNLAAAPIGVGNANVTTGGRASRQGHHAIYIYIYTSVELVG